MHHSLLGAIVMDCDVSFLLQLLNIQGNRITAEGISILGSTLRREFPGDYVNEKASKKSDDLHSGEACLRVLLVGYNPIGNEVCLCNGRSERERARARDKERKTF